MSHLYAVVADKVSPDGFAAEGSNIRISLLRAPTAPDSDTDQGHHNFTFALLPHRGSFNEANVPAAGIHFNNPLQLRLAPSSSLSPGRSFDLSLPWWLRLEGDRNIILETIKRGEDDDHNDTKGSNLKTIVLRIYEAYGGHGRATIVT